MEKQHIVIYATVKGGEVDEVIPIETEDLTVDEIQEAIDLYLDKRDEEVSND